MILSLNIIQPDTSSISSPLCGLPTVDVDMNNMSLKLDVSKNGSTITNIFNNINLGTFVSSAPNQIITYGDYDIIFNWALNNFSITSNILFNIGIYKTGTTTPVSWEKFNLHLSLSKNGFIPYQNVFELYNYDVGNSTFFGLTGNKTFDIVLLNTNIIDSFGNQLLAYSSFTTLKRPFTTELHIYNMVGTKGTVNYYNNNLNTYLGSGNNLLICNNTNIQLKQEILLYKNNNNIIDTCTSLKTENIVKWTPEFITQVNCSNTCNISCINEFDTPTVGYYLDFTNVTPFNYNSSTIFITEFFDNQIKVEVFDYTATLITTILNSINLTYSVWSISPSAYLIPIISNFISSSLGDNVILFTNTFYSILGIVPIKKDFIVCKENKLYKGCHWWTIENTGVCNEYQFNNCSASNIIGTLQILNDDKSISDLTTFTVNSFSNTKLTFLDDGVYIIKIPTSVINVFEYYTLSVYCNIQACYLEYLKKYLCNTEKENCNKEDNSQFNSFIINVQTFMLLLNEENSFNFIYNIITIDKIEELYTIRTFINRLKEYCNPSNNACIPCNN